ncbi:CST complex subunit Ten1 [Ampelomyces quisqualis]|uniref:CST complex subunit Ten1 n=1 Tax=Ampelomyces quisqualis TaxID=50730 RepID=A0A6A5QRS8_AMPQU|nr:CST complex subunit Ten1 [Ampelomyces quisqualis]
MSSGPVPSTLYRLGDLGQCKSGMKVRFLGCVDNYDVKGGALRLKHQYPASSPLSTVHVNIVHVLERLKRHELDVGTWLNVIGYVGRHERALFVQAVAVWDAGDVDVEAYEKAVDERKPCT